MINVDKLVDPELRDDYLRELIKDCKIQFDVDCVVDDIIVETRGYDILEEEAENYGDYMALIKGFQDYIITEDYLKRDIPEREDGTREYDIDGAHYDYAFFGLKGYIKQVLKPELEENPF